MGVGQFQTDHFQCHITLETTLEAFSLRDILKKNKTTDNHESDFPCMQRLDKSILKS